MKSAIRKIDRAIKQLYNIDVKFKAEHFLLKLATDEETSAICNGQLLIRENEGLELAIYLNSPVRKQLSRFGSWKEIPWTTEQLGAFCVATEEVSHFLYLLHHVVGGRPVSQLELELQAEIDKFVLTLLSHPHTEDTASEFDLLFDRLFTRFRLADKLTPEQQDRYLRANALAKRFIRKWVRGLSDPGQRDKVLRTLRRFYRLSQSEKLSLLA